MSRQDINQEFNTFVGGILTEANPINYPKGFTLDEENFILQRNGTRRRRRGLDFESGYTTTTIKQTSGIFKKSNGQQIIRWGEDKVAVIIGGAISTFDVTGATGISATESVISGTTTDQYTSVTTYRDLLSIARDDIDFTTVSLTGTPTVLTDEIGYELFNPDETSAGENVILVRDLVGLPDAEGTTRPVTLTNEHLYNLLNAGWSATNIAQFFTDTATYPTIYDNMNTGLDAETGVFTSTWVTLANAGTTVAPKGHFLVNAMNPNLSREGNIFEANGSTAGTLTQPTASGGSIVSMTEYAGRLFFAANMEDEHPIGRAILFYSPSAADKVDLKNCHQINDPTARDFNSPIPTDGGYFDISEVGIVYRIIPLKDRLFIFSSNGVYELFSADNIFSPVSTALRKITESAPIATSNTRSSMPTSICEHIAVAEDTVCYFSSGGIYKLAFNSGSSTYTAVNISAPKIQTLYNDIHIINRSLARALYVPQDQTIRWLYSEGGITLQDVFIKELVYDIVLDAWYKNDYAPETKSSGIHMPLFHLLINPQTSTDDYPVSPDIRYICVDSETGNPQSAPMRFCSFQDTFTDFDEPGQSRDSTAFLQTGYINAGDTQRYKQASYIVPSFLRTEDGFTDDGNGNLTPTHESSCNITAYWDYADTAASNKIGTAFEGYRYNRLYIPANASDTFDYGQSVITTKNKLLGRGRALSLRFESSTSKDCRLLGWGLGFEANTKV